MDANFSGQRCPIYQPSLAELVDNIRRNLEVTANRGPWTFNPATNGPFRNQRLGPFSRTMSMGPTSPGPVTAAAAAILSPRYRSRASSHSSTCSMDRRCQQAGYNQQESLLQAAAARLRRGSVNGLNEFTGQPGPCSPVRSPGLQQQQQQGPLASIGEDMLARELAAAACCCRDVYSSSGTPSIAGEDTYEFVERLADVDFDSDVWTFENA